MVLEEGAGEARGYRAEERQLTDGAGMERELEDERGRWSVLYHPIVSHAQ